MEVDEAADLEKDQNSKENIVTNKESLKNENPAVQRSTMETLRSHLCEIQPPSHYTPRHVLTEHQTAAMKNLMLEHCYSRPYHWRPESSFLRPTKTLFIPQANTKRRHSGGAREEELIDVDTIPSELPIIYDAVKAKKLMEECSRHAGFARGDKDDDDWEDKILRTNWNSMQSNIFDSTVKILKSDRLSRLAYEGVHNEPVLVRTVIEKSLKRFRLLMAKFSWDTKLSQWLHQLLLDNLGAPFLGAYFDILQTMKQKLPTFVDKMLFGPNSHSRVGYTSNEGLFSLLKRPWDPVASSLNMDKPKKLPGNPVIVIVPNAPCTTNNAYSKRLHRWIHLFSNLATVCTVHNNIGSAGHKLTMMNCVDQMFAATRAKIQEFKAEYPNRPIVLAGFNAGAALALQVAQVETVLCVLCLGFSLHTAEGNRGEPDDNLLELQCPILFVIGQCANTTLKEGMEDLRERMRVETGLLVVGSADDHLRVTKKKKRSEGITQSVVDRCIVDEVGEFVGGLLLSPYPPQIRQSPSHVPSDMIKRPKMERKRNNSNGSSMDSEPPSPTSRVPRPGQSLSPVLGRPPGSKAKSKIEAKWHAMQQGNSSNTPPSSSSSTISQTNIPNIPDTPFTDATQSTEVKRKIILTKTAADKTSQSTQPTSASAKLQAMGIPPGRAMYHGSTLSGLLQSGVRTLPPNPQKQIKVLENLTLSSHPKIIPGRSVDISKMGGASTSSSAGKISSGGSYGNVMLMPDGKIKSCGPVPIRGPNGAMIFPKGKPMISAAKTPFTKPTVPRQSVPKYITSKKQLISNKNKMIKKIPPYVSGSSGPGLPPPANLTSQNIMDIPIIFADDNQMLANNTMQPSDMPSAQILQPTQSKKLVFVNKSASSSSNVYSQNVLKRPLPPTKANPIKYAKIILSKAPSTDEKKVATISGQRIIKDVQPNAVPMDIDLENELVATAITKPNFVTHDKNVPMIYKMSDSHKSMILTESVKRRKIEPDFDDDSDDPEYIPGRDD